VYSSERSENILDTFLEASSVFLRKTGVGADENISACLQHVRKDKIKLVIRETVDI